VSAPVIAVLNLKGGVGKTTVTASIGRGMFDHKVCSVLLIDLDPQFNLTQALQPETEYKAYLDESKTVLTAFEPPPSTDLFRIRTSASPPPPASELQRVLWHYTKTPDKVLALIMGNFDLVKYSLLSNHEQLNSAKSRFDQFIAASREAYDVILLDCNPSSSFLTRCALEVSTDILVPVRPDKYSILGLDLLKRFIQRLGMAKGPRFHILLNATSRGTFSEPEELLRSSEEYGRDTLKFELFKSDILLARPSYHGFPVDRKVGYSRRLKGELGSICTELSQRMRI
jgi:chromosome partitioning protein